MALKGATGLQASGKPASGFSGFSGRGVPAHPARARPRPVSGAPRYARTRTCLLHASRHPVAASRSLARSTRGPRQPEALPMVTWVLRRCAVALCFYGVAVGLDPVWPLLGIPWSGPRFLLGGAAGLTAAWALAWATRPHRWTRRARARRAEARARAEALGLAAVRQALRQERPRLARP